jgi:hypothetical protein
MANDGNLDSNCEWFLGREIQIRLCMGNILSARVIDYANDVGWFIVQYEDGDTEELYWKELLEIILAFGCYDFP